MGSGVLDYPGGATRDKYTRRRESTPLNYRVIFYSAGIFIVPPGDFRTVSMSFSIVFSGSTWLKPRSRSPGKTIENAFGHFHCRLVYVRLVEDLADFALRGDRRLECAKDQLSVITCGNQCTWVVSKISLMIWQEGFLNYSRENSVRFDFLKNGIAGTMKIVL